MTSELTEERIAAAMARAEQVECRGDGRCFALPHVLSDAVANCSAQRAPEGTVSEAGAAYGVVGSCQDTPATS